MCDFKGFYKKTREQRLDILKSNNIIDENAYNYLLESKILSNEIASKMVENQLSVYGLPFSVATNFIINNTSYIIPMVVEEPSVVAAASNGAKIVGNISTSMEKRYMIGQISYYDVLDIEKAKKYIHDNEKKLLKLADLAHESIVNLGGGAKKITVEEKGDFLIVYLYVDVLDAMGANIINTMLETIAPIICENISSKRLMSIISNYSTNSVAYANCKIKVEKELGEKIQKAYEFALVDEYRAVTNNKGIFNGVDALAIATGNDWRAIEACGNSYACRNGRYEPLTKWEYKDGYLYGSIELAIPIATVGGSIKLNELSKISLQILKNPNANMLSQIAVALGLVQNFAALRALVTDGIQKGHMKLQANSVALLAGANKDEVEIIVSKIIENGKIDIDNAKKILKEVRNECTR
ncbi:hydroxymethylglutaryl-CoA reductase, degradative [Caviibacter abscessus]|uniref:hydroxymethylglutaryl-CoA reductase, degradative n=1 Tax=Caviibacter abscessus TaxID=1766719 RepID=UPI00082A0728|nr:hydroxymethylglutaryl-CoA reductase, degradative [Caviibacter abscessus]